MTRRRRLWVLALVIAIAAVTPSYVRVYRVSGASDAPTFLLGDRIVVNKAAYDIRLPYTRIVILSRSQPRAGDVVMFREPRDEVVVFKRVIGCPGDTVVMRDNRLTINGVPLEYEPASGDDFSAVASDNSLGAIIETEAGNGPPHLVTYTPGAGDAASFGPVEVPDDHFFLMGDNRDNSLDSRMYGPVPRRSVVGRVIRTGRRRGETG
jgi:signal peptidase I